MESIKIKVAGELIHARAGETVIHSLWNAGKAELIKTGCVGGVCGACTITVRSSDGKMKGTDLACMCPVEDGMEVFPCPVDSALSLAPEPNPTEEKLRKAFPKIDKCTKCGSCTSACPMSIPVMDSVLRMRSGQLDKVADDFTTCIHCGLCRFVCEDGVQPHMMGMWIRRSIGSSLEKDMGKKLDQDLGQAELEWKYLLEGTPVDRMNHARRFRKSGEIEL
ncbi:MAG: 4Fe-4S dicluster domain-containing protein [Nitrospina sp.]|nr:4Fe-4S dicluster domain-containing protein [Nitrospina sp.]MBT6600691.1 4Fe-4S dicluster domain-containing protein [Nitrospina sp.]